MLYNSAQFIDSTGRDLAACQLPKSVKRVDLSGVASVIERLFPGENIESVAYDLNYLAVSFIRLSNSVDSIRAHEDALKKFKQKSEPERFFSDSLGGLGLSLCLSLGFFKAAVPAFLLGYFFPGLRHSLETVNYRIKGEFLAKTHDIILKDAIEYAHEFFERVSYKDYKIDLLEDYPLYISLRLTDPLLDNHELLKDLYVLDNLKSAYFKTAHETGFSDTLLESLLTGKVWSDYEEVKVPVLASIARLLDSGSQEHLERAERYIAILKNKVREVQRLGLTLFEDRNIARS